MFQAPAPVPFFATPTPAAQASSVRAHRHVLPLAVVLTVALAGCASAPSTAPVPPTVPAAAWSQTLPRLLPTDVLLLGEKHDAIDHQQLQRQTVLQLAEKGQLAALVMEMAEQGVGTAGLPRDATNAQAQAALQWRDNAWPWKAYGPVVMAAVGAGVPVLGGNLPRSQMRAAMGETRWDQHLPAPALQRQYEALREGHCGLLPESQIGPMARIQIARDASMAQVAREAVRPGQTVLLVAGSGHVLRHLGIPTHWPKEFQSKVAIVEVESSLSAIKTEADAWVVTPPLPPRDHCAELREQWKASAPQPAKPSTPPTPTQ